MEARVKVRGFRTSARGLAASISWWLVTCRCRGTGHSFKACAPRLTVP